QIERALPQETCMTERLRKEIAALVLSQKTNASVEANVVRAGGQLCKFDEQLRARENPATDDYDKG
ncbi:unnamed protein product, partial [Amoebophrya sp. A25]